MKKFTILTIAVVALLTFGVGTAAAEHSIGYQGLLGTGTNVLSGLSYRGWADAMGWEGTLFHGTADNDGDDVSIWLLEGQFMYAVIQNTNSKLFVGAELAYGRWDVDDYDDSFWWAGPLVGAQYNFQEMPEMSFNWEVAYDFIDTGDLDVSLTGFNTTMGIHYAF